MNGLTTITRGLGLSFPIISFKLLVCRALPHLLISTKGSRHYFHTMKLHVMSCYPLLAQPRISHPTLKLQRSSISGMGQAEHSKSGRRNKLPLSISTREMRKPTQRSVTVFSLGTSRCLTGCWTPSCWGQGQNIPDPFASAPKESCLLTPAPSHSLSLGTHRVGG